MTEAEKRKYKQELYQHAVEIIQQRIAEIKLAMDDAQASANSEEKSSAGDKYETSRAMSHLQKDMHAKQLAANNEELARLLAVDRESIYDVVSTGCMVICDDISFLVGPGLGKVLVNGQVVYFLSAAAPLAISLFGKRKGDSVVFNNKTMLIRDIF